MHFVLSNTDVGLKSTNTSYTLPTEFTFVCEINPTGNSSSWIVYTNGVQAGIRNGYERRTGTFSIGKLYPIDTYSGNVSFYGKIKNCALYNRVLTTDEISRLEF